MTCTHAALKRHDLVAARFQVRFYPLLLIHVHLSLSPTELFVSPSLPTFPPSLLYMFSSPQLTPHPCLIHLPLLSTFLPTHLFVPLLPASPISLSPSLSPHQSLPISYCFISLRLSLSSIAIVQEPVTSVIESSSQLTLTLTYCEESSSLAV